MNGSIDEGLDYRMTAVNYFDFIAIVHCRSHISPPHRCFSQRGQGIKTGQGPSRGLDARSFGGHLPADERKDLRFKLEDAFFCAQNFAFPFFQGGRGESFGVRQSLATFIVMPERAQRSLSKPR